MKIKLHAVMKMTSKTGFEFSSSFFVLGIATFGIKLPFSTRVPVWRSALQGGRTCGRENINKICSPSPARQVALKTEVRRSFITTTVRE